MLVKTNREGKWAAFYLVIFAILAVLVKMHASWLYHCDYAVTAWFSSIITPGKTAFFKVIATLGSPLFNLAVGMIIAVILILTRRNFANGIFMGMTLIISNGVAVVVKHIIKRPRPTMHLAPANGYSFPSGHVFGTTLLMIMIVALLVKKLHSNAIQVAAVCLASVWVILVLLSRIYLRAHYLSDTLGAILLAAGCWELVKFIYFQWQKLYRVNNSSRYHYRVGHNE